MNLSAFILGFVTLALISGMIVFVSSTQSLEVVDDNGHAAGNTSNLTTGLVSNVTAVGGTATGYLVLIIASLGLCAGIALLYVYSKRY